MQRLESKTGLIIIQCEEKLPIRWIIFRGKNSWGIVIPLPTIHERPKATLNRQLVLAIVQGKGNVTSPKSEATITSISIFFASETSNKSLVDFVILDFTTANALGSTTAIAAV